MPPPATRHALPDAPSREKTLSCGVIDLAGHPITRFERPLHPAVNPHGGVLAREMNSALGPRHVWQQRAELARLVVGARATGPLVVVPALRHATLEVIPHAGVDRVHVFEREVMRSLSDMAVTRRDCRLIGNACKMPRVPGCAYVVSHT